MMYLIFLLSKPVLISISLGRHCPDCTIRRGQEKNNFINTKDKIVMEDNIKRVSYLGADRSCRTGLLVGLGLQACWYCGFESLLWHGSLSPMSTVCCQVEVSATDRSLVQRRPRSTRAVELWEKKEEELSSWKAAVWISSSVRCCVPSRAKCVFMSMRRMAYFKA